MKTKLMTLIAGIALLSSCTNLRYTNYGKPLDFLKAQRVHEKSKVQTPSETASSAKYSDEKNEKIYEVATYEPSNGAENLQNEVNSFASENVSNTAISSETQSNTTHSERKSTLNTSQEMDKVAATTPFSRKLNPIVAKRLEKTFGNATTSTLVDSDVMFIICIILAFLIPPLAVFLTEGVTGRFWLNLILFLVGWGLGWYLFGGGIAFLCGLIAVVHALLIVLGAI